MNTLVIMAKHPVPGTVKTRLAASLGGQAAAELAEAFLEDLVVRLDGSADRQVLAPWPDNAAAGSFFETDGGYVLIGQRREIPGLYERINWSTSQVWQQTRDHLIASGTPFVELDGWYDVDTLDDLSRLDRELGPGDRQGRAGQLTRQRIDRLPPGWDTRPTEG